MPRPSKFIIIYLLFIVIGNTIAFAQSHGRIDGTVKDENGNTVMGAVIFAQSSGGGIVQGRSVTDIDGNFLIAPLPVGNNYEVNVSYEHFKKVIVTNVTVYSDRITKVNVPFNTNRTADTAIVYVPHIIDYERRSICGWEGVAKVPTRDFSKLIAVQAPTEKKKKGFSSFLKRKKKNNE